MSGRTKTTRRQQQAEDRPEAAEQEEVAVDIELRDQIVEAVEPLISDLNEQIVETVRATLHLDGSETTDADAAGTDDSDDTDRSDRSDRSDNAAGEDPSANAQQTDQEQQEPERADEEEVQMAADDRRQTRRRNTARGDGESERDAGRQGTRRGERQQSGRQEGGRRGGNERALARTRDQRQQPARRRMPDEVFSARSAVPVALLRLGNASLVTGSIYTAIHAYTQILERYPDTGAANAAVENLLSLAERLQDEGRYYTALNILNQVEELTY
jgi:tetratricopeptide (TPR) repeat protein